MEQMEARNQQFPSCCWLMSIQWGSCRRRGIDVVE
jgi:hypothetical protein